MATATATAEGPEQRARNEQLELERVKTGGPPTCPGFYWVWDDRDSQIVVWVVWKDVLTADKLVVEIPGSEGEWELNETRFKKWGERIPWPGDSRLDTGLLRRLEADNMRMAAELEKRAAPLNELDVRHIVATEMARVMLSQVLLGENSQLLATSKSNAELARKLDAMCDELDKQRREALDQRDKWAKDAAQWAGDYLKLARLLGVPEDVRDRSVVANAEGRVTARLLEGRNADIDQAEKIVKHALDGFDSVTVSVANLREVIAKRIAELRATIGAP